MKKFSLAENVCKWREKKPFSLNNKNRNLSNDSFHSLLSVFPTTQWIFHTQCIKQFFLIRARCLFLLLSSIFNADFSLNAFIRFYHTPTLKFLMKNFLFAINERFEASSLQEKDESFRAIIFRFFIMPGFQLIRLALLMIGTK